MSVIAQGSKGEGGGSGCILTWDFPPLLWTLTLFLAIISLNIKSACLSAVKFSHLVGVARRMVDLLKFYPVLVT